jgi:hypothetical protein
MSAAGSFTAARSSTVITSSLGPTIDAPSSVNSARALSKLAWAQVRSKVGRANATRATVLNLPPVVRPLGEGCHWRPSESMGKREFFACYETVMSKAKGLSLKDEGSGPTIDLKSGPIRIVGE